MGPAGALAKAKPTQADAATCCELTQCSKKPVVNYQNATKKPLQLNLTLAPQSKTPSYEIFRRKILKTFIPNLFRNLMEWISSILADGATQRAYDY